MPKPTKSISTWLLIGCIMVMIQIFIGGITRLTDSGLSITEWNVVKGTIPPLSDAEWQISFEKYKIHAAKQFTSIHQSMTISEFKKIYFWEYFHRLWARLMGFVFIIPFIYFLIRKKLDWKYISKLIVVVILASLSAIFGWIMVASGLNDDKRTWVNAYNLLIHLILATSLFSYLVYTYYAYRHRDLEKRIILENYFMFKLMGIILFCQIGFGALMAGMKAGLIFPYPILLLKLDVMRSIVTSSPPLQVADWINYEPNPIIKIIVQVVHRLTAYSLLILSVWFFFVNRAKMFMVPSFLIYYVLLIFQICLGIMTVMFSIGKIPVFYGVIHQLIAFLLLASYLWMLFATKKR